MGDADDEYTIRINFTFHYVSILIWLLSGHVCQTLTFTFHYVSILIHLNGLHNVAGCRFTFHYVSILILLCVAKQSVLSDFTFHYVSILIQKQIDRVINAKLYIPLCLYFNKYRIS